MPVPEPQRRGAVRVYTRPGCHLCEQLVDDLLPLLRGRVALEVCDVDSRPDWKLEFGARVPVVEYGGETVCQYRLDTAAIRAILNALPAVGAASAANDIELIRD